MLRHGQRVRWELQRHSAPHLINQDFLKGLFALPLESRPRNGLIGEEAIKKRSVFSSLSSLPQSDFLTIS